MIAINEQNMAAFTQIIREACGLGGIQLMKQTNIARNLGKSPELVMAECIVAALRMQQSMGGDDIA
jgi:hypothetical protein